MNKLLIAGIAALSIVAGPAFADTAVSTKADRPVAEIAVDLAKAAAQICKEGAAAGEVYDMDACVVEVVEAVANEVGDLELIDYVETNTQVLRAAAFGE